MKRCTEITSKYTQCVGSSHRIYTLIDDAQTPGSLAVCNKCALTLVHYHKDTTPIEDNIRLQSAQDQQTRSTSARNFSSRSHLVKKRLIDPDLSPPILFIKTKMTKTHSNKQTNKDTHKYHSMKIQEPGRRFFAASRTAATLAW
ncbi:hypothetical protein CROQUDRAFT_651682 [Cronartium quercuum f. sp. fusiforme G11]|uniref:Uncharacterized protein n=1 Tax=Cronartium quercuum f. sp. fusiforme G11 TaxID=708437 RepID=A0A9P6NSK5_9BASI|nr:hypothetical protein CROQUDRAFT_651682 [Cronartium quercuum f. sp. fusiforme G11]